MSARNPPQQAEPIQAVLLPLQPAAEDEIKLADIRYWLLAGRWWIAALTGLGLAISIAWAFLQRPVFRAETVLIAANDERSGLNLSGMGGGIGQLAGLVGLSLDAGSNKDEFVALLRSRSFTEAFIEDQKLLPILFDKQWDAQAQRWRPTNPQKIPTLYRGFKLFDKKVRTIIESKGSSIVTLRIEWRDNELAAGWANLMVERLNELARQRAIDDASKSLEYLNRELANASAVELRESISKLIQTQMSKQMLATVRRDYAFRVLDTARAPDLNAYVRPQRILLIALGLVLGALLGAGIALLRGVLSNAPAQ
jgi:uncharacterized protein involved in exopolysaccharide biosynthesis